MKYRNFKTFKKGYFKVFFSQIGMTNELDLNRLSLILRQVIGKAKTRFLRAARFDLLGQIIFYSLY